MPLNEVGRRYEERLFQKRFEEIERISNQEIARIGAEHTKQNNMLLSGSYFTARSKVLVEQIQLLGEARADSLLKAYEKSGLPFDDAALHEIKDEVMQYCHQQQHGAVGSTSQIVNQAFAGASAPPNLEQACVNEIVNGVTAIMSRLDRDLLIRRDEVILDETKMRQVYAAGLGKEWDVFICHASEDKENFVRPLATMLQESGLTVWYDEFTLKIGDSLRRKIDEGLANSRYGVVVLSRYFFAKNWPQQELDGLVSKEVVGTGTKVILPVWHEISIEEVHRNSPMLSGRVAAKSNDGLRTVVNQLRDAMGLAADGVPKILQVPRYLTERRRLVREQLGKIPQPWQRALLREILVRGQMDEAHATGFLGENGFGHMSGALNGLQFHTSFVVRDMVGQYSVNPELREALSAELDEQQL
jgi:hypothetical protein